MILKTQYVISLIITSIYSGAFGVISFICFFFTHHVLTPELNIFITFLDSNNLSSWAHSNLCDLESFLDTLCILVLSAITAAIGLFSAIVAKSLQEEAVKDFTKASKS
jgi:hypothetical protein